MTKYPGQIDDNTSLPPATGDDAVSVNANIAATEAIETALGLLPFGPYASVRTRLDILEARINNPFSPAPNVSNPFYIGVSGVSIQTGFGDPGLLMVPALSGSLYLREDGYNYQGLYVFGTDGYWHQVLIANSTDLSTRTITASYIVDSAGSDYLILCNNSAPINVTLPTPTNGRELVIKDQAGSSVTNHISILPHAAEQIDGTSSRVIQTNYSSLMLMSDGVSWWIV